MTDAEEPAPSEEAAPPASVPRGLPSGWVQLSAATLRERLAVPQNLALYGLFAVIQVFRLVSIFVQPDGRFDLGGFVVATVISVGAGVAIIFTSLPFIAPIAEANFDTGTLRWRRKTLPFAEVATATLVALKNSYSSPVTSLTLSIGAGKGLKVPFVLTNRDTIVLDIRRRTLLAEVIRRSKIAYPTDPYDPTGKFARYNFPGALTRDEALEVVLHPPGAGDPLPISG